MATKADFTEQEWDALQKGVTGSAMLVSVADRGFFDTFKEVGAISKHLSEARKNHDTPLIKEIASVRGTGFGLTASPDEVEKGTMDALSSGVSALKAKAPDEVDEYQAFIIEIAESVGKAADDLGATETGAIEKIKAALQTT